MKDETIFFVRNMPTVSRNKFKLNESRSYQTLSKLANNTLNTGNTPELNHLISTFITAS